MGVFTVTRMKKLRRKSPVILCCGVFAVTRITCGEPDFVLKPSQSPGHAQTIVVDEHDVSDATNIRELLIDEANESHTSSLTEAIHIDSDIDTQDFTPSSDPIIGIGKAYLPEAVEPPPDEGVPDDLETLQRVLNSVTHSTNAVHRDVSDETDEGVGVETRPEPDIQDDDAGQRVSSISDTDLESDGDAARAQPAESPAVSEPPAGVVTSDEVHASDGQSDGPKVTSAVNDFDALPHEQHLILQGSKRGGRSEGTNSEPEGLPTVTTAIEVGDYKEVGDYYHMDAKGFEENAAEVAHDVPNEMDRSRLAFKIDDDYGSEQGSESESRADVSATNGIHVERGDARGGDLLNGSGHVHEQHASGDHMAVDESRGKASANPDPVPGSICEGEVQSQDGAGLAHQLPAKTFEGHPGDVTPSSIALNTDSARDDVNDMHMTVRVSSKEMNSSDSTTEVGEHGVDLSEHDERQHQHQRDITNPKKKLLESMNNNMSSGKSDSIITPSHRDQSESVGKLRFGSARNQVGRRTLPTMSVAEHMTGSEPVLLHKDRHPYDDDDLAQIHEKRIHAVGVHGHSSKAEASKSAAHPSIGDSNTLVDDTSRKIGKWVWQKSPDDMDVGHDAGDIRKTDSLTLSHTSTEELAQRMKEMEVELRRKIAAEEDVKSLLDIWVETTREYILTRTVPPTDAECDFNWSKLRCEPKCICGSRLRFGDYTPGRSCRLLPAWEVDPTCEETWDPSDEAALKRAVTGLAHLFSKGTLALEARVASPSESECTFDWSKRRCEPQAMCRLQFKWGDLSLRRACRRKADKDVEEVMWRGSEDAAHADSSDTSPRGAQ